MKRKGTVGSLGECNQTGRRPSPHEGRRAFSIFDPPSMEPCRGEHTAQARILRNDKCTECEKQTKGICSLNKSGLQKGNPIQIH